MSRVADEVQRGERAQRALAACAGRAGTSASRRAAGWSRSAAGGRRSRPRGPRRRRGRRATAAIIRADDLLVGLAPRRPERVPQVPPASGGLRSGVRPRPNCSPSNMLVDSMTRSSVTISRPRASASGCAVSCARSSGETRRCAMSRSPTRRRPARPSSGRASERWKPVAAAVEDALGVVHLAVAQQVDDRVGGLAHLALLGVRRRPPGGGGQGVEHGLDGAVVVGGGQEPRLVRRRRQVDALRRAWRGRTRRTPPRRCARRRRSRGPARVGEEHREHRAGRLDDVRRRRRR